MLSPLVIDAGNAYLTIDGSSELGYAGSPIVEVDGFADGGGFVILVLANGVTLRGLAITRCGENGVEVSADGTVIEGC